jgi:flagellar L-ring protein precursor FlgH
MLVFNEDCIAKYNKLLNIIFVLLLAVGNTGCSYLKEQPKPDDPRYAPVPPQALTPTIKPVHDGSLYQDGFGLTLYTTMNATRVGDLLTVVFNEKTDAAKNNGTNLSKETKVNIENPTLLGQPVQFTTPGFMPLQGGNNNLAFGLSSNSEFKGDGSIGMKNSFDTIMTVSVVEVYPNGNMVIRGEKWVTLSSGDEFIRLTGIVRPEDITSIDQYDNAIYSDRIADSRIVYSSKGDIKEANTIGWLSSFLMSGLWPF